MLTHTLVSRIAAKSHPPITLLIVARCLIVLVNAVGLPVFRHVLVPRSKGLWMCTERLRAGTSAIYDITIAYSSKQKSTSNDNSTFHAAAPTLSGRQTYHLLMF